MDCATQVLLSLLQHHRERVTKGGRVDSEQIPTVLAAIRDCPVRDQTSLVEHFALTLAASDNHLDNVEIYRAGLLLSTQGRKDVQDVRATQRPTADITMRIDDQCVIRELDVRDDDYLVAPVKDIVGADLRCLCPTVHPVYEHAIERCLSEQFLQQATYSLKTYGGLGRFRASFVPVKNEKAVTVFVVSLGWYDESYGDHPVD